MPGLDEPIIPLHPVRVTARALHTMRARWRRVLPVAVVVVLVAGLGELFEHAVEEIHFSTRTFAVLAAVIVGLTTGTAALGATLLAGVLDHTVGEHQHGHPDRPLWNVVKHLPWVTLIAADLMVTALRIVGFGLLILPGLAVVTLTAIVGPLIILERRSAVGAIAESVRLVWPRFWLVALLVTVPLVFEAGVSALIEEVPWLYGTLAFVVALVLVEAPLSLFVALIEVTLAYQLIERARPGAVAAAVHHH